MDSTSKIFFGILLIWCIYNSSSVNNQNYRVNILKNRQNEFSEKEDSILNITKSWLGTEKEIYEKKLQSIFGDKSVDFELELEDHLIRYEKRYKELKSEIKKQESQLSKIRESKKRAEKGLPNAIAVEKAMESINFRESQRFNTKKGSLLIPNYGTSFFKVPSTGKIAFVRMGEEKCHKQESIIKAFINESKNSKIEDGYVLSKNEPKTTDYGKSTRKTYKNGDSYFITYYEFEREQGTYDRWSYNYTYFIEFGLESRRKKYHKEQYSNKIGN